MFFQPEQQQWLPRQEQQQQQEQPLSQQELCQQQQEQPLSQQELYQPQQEQPLSQQELHQPQFFQQQQYQQQPLSQQELCQQQQEQPLSQQELHQPQFLQQQQYQQQPPLYPQQLGYQQWQSLPPPSPPPQQQYQPQQYQPYQPQIGQYQSYPFLLHSQLPPQQYQQTEYYQPPPPPQQQQQQQFPPGGYYQSPLPPSPQQYQPPWPLQHYCQQAQEVPREDWFRYITGVPEEEFRHDVGTFIDSPAAASSDGPKSFPLRITNRVTGRVFECGTFDVVSLSELIAAYKDMGPCANKELCKFKIVTASDTNNFASREFVDVANLQADPRNAGCTFQVASNFNGIEGIDESTFPDSKNFTTNYIYDLTQGPVASVSAGPSAIARVYGAFYKPGTDPRLWAQTTRRQHRMLGDVSCITVANGYAMLDEMTSATLPANPYDIVNKICVGVQKGAQVTFGKCITRSDGKTMLQCVPQDIRINQVFCAALNMAQGEAGARTSNHPQAKVVERCVLRAAYEGSYLAAITAGSPRLFLTMIGGGAFGNLQSTILGEIIRAHKKYGMSSELREVVLVMYKVPENIDDICEEMRENGIPLECVIYTNGIPVSC